MASRSNRQRNGRIVPWILAGLVLVAALLIGYRFVPWSRYHADPALLGELQNAALQAGDPQAAAPGEWPQWRGPRRDGVSLETGLRTDWPKDGLPVHWKAPVGAGYGSFAVAAGRVYVLLQAGDNEAVVCWDADTGKEAWRFAYPCKYENQFGNGPRSTPTVEGDRVYTVGATGIFHCLKAATGEQVWRHNLLDKFKAVNLQWGVTFSPLVEGDLIYTNPGGSGGSSLAAFDKLTGQLAWEALDDPAGYSSPIAVTMAGVRQILFFTGSGLVSVSPKDGTLYWRFPWVTDYGCNVATPIAVGEYVFISSGYNRGCALLKVTRDGDRWEAKSVYETTHMCNHFASSVLYQEHLYGFNESMLTCLELRTGKEKWSRRGFDKGSLLIADGHLVILGEKGKLALAEATPAGYREQASYHVLDGKCWSVPVFAGGKLYVRDEEQVLCLDAKKK